MRQRERSRMTDDTMILKWSINTRLDHYKIERCCYCLTGVSCSDEDEKPRKRRRTNSSSSSPVVLKEVPKAVVPVSKTITVPVSGSPKMSNIMQSIANSLPPHMSPVKITFTKPSTQTTNSTTQKVCGRGNLCLPGAALISFSQCDSDLTNMHWVLTMCLALWWECSHLFL